MSEYKNKLFVILRKLFSHILVIVTSLAITLFFFLVLPLMQTLAKPLNADLVMQSVETAKMEAPEPPPEIEEEQEPQQDEEPPPELSEDTPPLDLSQLELALNPNFNESMMGGDFAIKLQTAVSDSQSAEALFSIADLDQKARIIYQPGPVMTEELRKKGSGKVYIIFIVNEQGRVENPVVQKSSDPAFEKAALAAVRQWRFEPGKRNGKAVKFRMRIPIVFQKEQ